MPAVSGMMPEYCYLEIKTSSPRNAFPWIVGDSHKTFHQKKGKNVGAVIKVVE